MLQILPPFGAKLTQISVRNPLKAFIVTIFILHFKALLNIASWPQINKCCLSSSLIASLLTRLRIFLLLKTKHAIHTAYIHNVLVSVWFAVSTILQYSKSLN